MNHTYTLVNESYNIQNEIKNFNDHSWVDLEITNNDPAFCITYKKCTNCNIIACSIEKGVYYISTISWAESYETKDLTCNELRMKYILT